MHAKLVNEVNQFQRGLDPKQAMGIGELAPLEKKYKVHLSSLTPNEILVFGILKEYALDIVRYALNNGANQIWYKRIKENYREFITAPDFSPQFVIITKVTVSSYDEDMIDKIFYKDVTEQIFSNGKMGTQKASSIFPSRFHAVDSKFLKIIEETIKRGTILKEYLKSNDNYIGNAPTPSTRGSGMSY